jgi:hypothetical protein
MDNFQREDDAARWRRNNGVERVDGVLRDTHFLPHHSVGFGGAAWATEASQYAARWWFIKPNDENAATRQQQEQQKHCCCHCLVDKALISKAE